jgi:hypothetical protein
MEEIPMKRLALALAAAVLGTGCSGSHHAPATGSALLYWDFVRTAPAQAGGAVTYDATLTGTGTVCPQSDVDTVTVDAPGVAQISVPCVYSGVQGVTVSNVLAGSNVIRVRGWRQGVAVYDDTFTVDVIAGNNAPAGSYLDVRAVQAPIDLFAYLFTTDTSQYYPTCASASNPEIDYDVWDSFGTHVLSATASCTEPANPTAVFVGNLDLDNYTVRMKGFTVAGGGVPVFDSCTGSTAQVIAFDHFGSQTGAGGIPVTLTTPPPPGC